MNTEKNIISNSNLFEKKPSINYTNCMSNNSSVVDRSHLYGRQVRLSIHYDRMDDKNNKTRVSISAVPNKDKNLQNNTTSNNSIVYSVVS